MYSSTPLATIRSWPLKVSSWTALTSGRGGGESASRGLWTQPIAERISAHQTMPTFVDFIAAPVLSDDDCRWTSHHCGDFFGFSASAAAVWLKPTAISSGVLPYLSRRLVFALCLSTTSIVLISLLDAAMWSAVVSLILPSSSNTESTSAPISRKTETKSLL